MQRIQELKFFLPLLTLIVVYAAYIPLIHYFGAVFYSYDETIMTEISKQPLNDLLDTVKAEPHPPGFYFFLKLLDVTNIKSTRTIISTISISLVLGATLLLYRGGFIKKYNLTWGLVFFYLSPLFITVATNIKQDALSFPLFLLGLVLLLFYFQGFTLPKLIGIWFIGSLLLLLGYIYFVDFIFILYCAAFLYKMDKRLITLCAVLAVEFFIYFIVYGNVQFRNNAGRFSWLQYNDRSVVTSFKTSLSGPVLYDSFYTDLLLIPFLAALVLFIVRWQEHTPFERSVFIISVWLFVPLVFFNLLARSRYAIVPVFFMFLCFAWSLRAIYKPKWMLHIAFSTFLFMGSMNWNRACFFIEPEGHKYAQLISQVLADNGETGLLMNHPLAAFIYRLSYFLKDDRLIPVNFLAPEESLTPTYLTASKLLLDGKYEDLSEETIISNLKKTKAMSFLYIFSPLTYYDPNQKIVSALNAYCSKTRVYTNTNVLGIVYTECGN